MPIAYVSEPPATADLVIVGGGIVGAATAFHASRAGLQPLVLERAARTVDPHDRRGRRRLPAAAREPRGARADRRIRRAVPALRGRHGPARARRGPSPAGLPLGHDLRRGDRAPAPAGRLAAFLGTHRRPADRRCRSPQGLPLPGPGDPTGQVPPVGRPHRPQGHHARARRRRHDGDLRGRLRRRRHRRRRGRRPRAPNHEGDRGNPIRRNRRRALLRPRRRARRRPPSDRDRSPPEGRAARGSRGSAGRTDDDRRRHGRALAPGVRRRVPALHRPLDPAVTPRRQRADRPRVRLPAARPKQPAGRGPHLALLANRLGARRALADAGGPLHDDARPAAAHRPEHASRASS